MRRPMRVATYTVHATAKQSITWNRAASAEGYGSTGTWLAQAADAYIKGQQLAGKPFPLAWKRATRLTFKLEDGTEMTLPGWFARPFGIFRGSAHGPVQPGGKTYSLVYLPTGRIVATFRFARYCRALAADLARLWVRWDGVGEPVEDPAAVLERHRAESL